MEKINFIVFIDVNFTSALTGGVVAMHKLAEKLAQKGEKVFIPVYPEYPNKNIIKVDFSFLSEMSVEDKNRSVVIYPQIQIGNPIEIPNVARWILYDVEDNIEDTFGINDEYFNFGTFKTNRKKTENKLTVFNYYFDILRNNNNGKRKKFCHLLHKHTPNGGEQIFQYLNSENLSGWKGMGCHDYLYEKFNEYEYFLTYDQKSFFPLAAGLCGTKTIILNPNKNYTPTEYRLENPIQMYGVAYGWDDISWAKKTIDFVPEYLKSLEKIDDKTVDTFINFWYDKLKL